MVSNWTSNTNEAQSHNKAQVAQYKSNFRYADLYFFPNIVLEPTDAYRNTGEEERAMYV